MLKTIIGLLVLTTATATGACAASTSDIAMHEAIVAHKKGAMSVATTRYIRALKLEPGIEGAKTNLAAIAFVTGELLTGLKWIQGELERRSSDPHAKLLRALTFIAMGRYDKAIEDAESFAALSGGLPAKTIPGKTRRATARLLVAIARMAKAGDARTGDAVVAVWDALDPVLELDFSKIKRKKTDPPLTDLKRIVAHARKIGGLLALTTGKYKRGLELLAVGATKKNPAPYPVLRLYGLLSLHKNDEALALVAQAEAGPLRSSPWAKVLRGHALVAKGKHAEVHKIVGGMGKDKGLPKPLRASALRLLAAASAKTGDWPKALTSLTRAAELLGKGKVSASLWLDQAVAQAHVGKLEAARRTVAGVLRDDPDDSHAKKLEALLK